MSTKRFKYTTNKPLLLDRLSEDKLGALSVFHELVLQLRLGVLTNHV